MMHQESGTLILFENRDLELVEKIKSGDQQAVEDFFSQHDLFRKIKYMVYGRSNGILHSELRDLISEVFEAIVNNLRSGHFDPRRGSLNAYLQGIIRNKIYNFSQDFKKNRQSYSIDDNNTNLFKSPIEDFEMKDLLGKALNNLKPDQRQIIVLRYLHDKGVDEIAEMLNLDSKQVHNKLNYSLRLIRDFVFSNGLRE